MLEKYMHLYDEIKDSICASQTSTPSIEIDVLSWFCHVFVFQVKIGRPYIRHMEEPAPEGSVGHTAAGSPRRRWRRTPPAGSSARQSTTDWRKYNWL